VDAIDNAVRVESKEAEALVNKSLEVLHSLVDTYGTIFRVIIDSYRLRLDDEFRHRGEPLVSSANGETPVNDFRAYIQMGVSRGIIPSFIVKEDIMMQAILFMAHSDEFSNIEYPVTGHEIEVYYDITNSTEDVDSLRKFAMDIKGPIGIHTLSNFMPQEEKQAPGWQPSAWRYSCSYLSV